MERRPPSWLFDFHSHRPALLLVVCPFETLDRMSLHSTISSTSATPSQLSVKAGDTGVATTRLALIGNAKIADCDVEVKSEDGFINEGTPIIVTRVNEALILVKKRSDK